MPKQNKKIRFRKNVKHYVDSDYKHKLNEKNLEWLNKFEQEYYDNDHVKEDSIHRKSLKDAYDKQIVSTKLSNDGITMKQAEMIRTNSLNKDIMNIMNNSKLMMSIEDVDQNLACDADPEESSEPLKYMEYADALNLYIENLIAELSVDGADKQKHIRSYTALVIRLWTSAQKLAVKEKNQKAEPYRKLNKQKLSDQKKALYRKRKSSV